MEIAGNCFAKFREYRYYRWVYVMGTICTFVNGMWLHNTQLFYLSLVVLYCILFYKGIHRIISYQKAEEKNYPSVTKKEFAKKYQPFRIKVFLFWLAFIVLCTVGKFVAQIEHWYFYSCTFFFLFLDRFFVNVYCLLRKFSDPKGEDVICCCGCPCRGWDLLMIHTPLLFALEPQMILENRVIYISSGIAFLSILYWEKSKYALVEVKKMCAKACNLSLCRENRS
ncbi:hypothetical protein [Chakrabartyella piscis]|uniref:hypothetical protein n=1 Tax=Chakrabartyella piscis TaxID=2918914 RepID=UPI002958B017|nr:hypothetical protein [Chakrabartyella piscis]